MEKEIQAALIGLGGVLVGGVITWLITKTTNSLQQRIAADNLALQQQTAAANLDLQKQLAADNAKFQKQLAEDTAKAQRLAIVESMILKLSEFAIQYPTVEKDDYCAAYPKCVGDVNGKERYENYCSYLFNTIGAVFEYCGNDPEKVKGMFHVEEMIKRHWRCWDGDKGNLGYDQPFRSYIQSIIDDLKRRREI